MVFGWGNDNESRDFDPAATTAVEYRLLPVLIIPGFMSSGLEIVESTTKPAWKSQRIWLNLSSLGISSVGSSTTTTTMTTRKLRDDGNDNKEDDVYDEETTRYYHFKSAWLEHMRLDAENCRLELDGVQVRAISGLEGVDYLTPGMFTNLVSYVFGPVINALTAAGYQKDVNLQAAPYDWRLPPTELERRDQYFTRTMRQVEEMYTENESTPVVLLCHSLGTKTAHYFLNFCLAKKGQKWIDEHVHTYLPVGAPHLGAPKALRSLINGDKMGLEAFLDDPEALVLGRSFGSGAWLLPPELPKGVPPIAYVTPHGVLHIKIQSHMETAVLTERRLAMSLSHRYQLLAVFENGGESRTIDTPFQPNLNTLIDFDEGEFTFATPVKAPTKARLQFILHEPGIKAAKFEDGSSNPILCFLNWLFCCCIWTWLCRIVMVIIGGLAQALILSADSIASLNVKRTTPLAISDAMHIPPAVWKGKSVMMDISLVHVDDYGKLQAMWCGLMKKEQRTTQISVEVKWTPHREPLPLTGQKCSAIGQPPKAKPSKVQIVNGDDRDCTAVSGYDMLDREGVKASLTLMKEDYDTDPLLPRTTKAPPVRRIHALYGTNLATETGAVYRRADIYTSPSTPLQSLYVLDKDAKNNAAGGSHVVDKGILKEKSASGAVSGDGTVPYWSLKHVETWKSATCNVTIEELSKAEHREILADARFHECLLRYVRIPKETV